MPKVYSLCAAVFLCTAVLAMKAHGDEAAAEAILQEPSTSSSAETEIRPPEPAAALPPAAAAPETGAMLDLAAEPAAQLTPPPAVRSEQAAGQTKNNLYEGKDSFIAPLKWRADGMILGSRDEKTMMSEGDVVYISINAFQIETGTECLIYRRIEKVKNPRTRQPMGVKLQLVGKLKITGDIGKDSATARIIGSREPIEKGDELRIVADKGR